MKPVLAPNRPTTLPRLARAAIVVGIFSAYFSYVFQFSKGTLFRFGIGDWMDPYFINLLMEHWYTSLVTLRDPSSLPIYFPIQGTLGWSHALVLYAPFYVVVRPFTDPIQAWTIALFAVLVIGSTCLHLVLRRLGLRFVEAVVLTAFFVTSPNIINDVTGIFAQTASVFLIPMITLLALGIERARVRAVRLALAAMSGLLFALLFTQEFYTGVFVVLVSVLLLVGVIPYADVVGTLARSAVPAVRDFLAPVKIARRPSGVWVLVAATGASAAAVIAIHPFELTRIGPWYLSARDPSRPLSIAIVAAGWYALRRWRPDTRLMRFAVGVQSMVADLNATFWRSPAGQWVGGRTALLVAAGGGVFAGAAVFLWIYLPSFLEFGAFPSEHLWERLHQPDVERWTSALRAWSDLWIYKSGRPFYLAMAMAVLLWLPASGVRQDLRRFALWAIAISILMLAIPLRFGEFSVWKAFFGWIPGIAVIRDPSRVIYVYELAVVCLVALVLRRATAAVPRVIVLAIVSLLMIADWNTHVFMLRRDRDAFEANVRAPIAIDPSCRTFFIKDASDEYEARSPNMWALYAIDSAFIAVQHGIPTMNGYSAWLPDDWELLEPQQPWYMKGVDEWITRHRLENACQLDIEARTMRPYKARSQGSP